MSDIIEKHEIENQDTTEIAAETETLESILQPDKPTIRPLDMVSRVPLYVYCSSFKGTRQLSRYGDVGYSSAKSNFTLVYVNEAEADEKIAAISQLKFVKRVKKGHIKELTHDFSEAFQKINLEVKAEMEADKTLNLD